MQRLTNAYPAANTGNKFVLTSFLEDYVGESRRSLVFVFVAVALVLLIACANVANLLLARGAVRKNEIAVRVALGATRMRLLRQLLSESVLLSAGGGALGILLAVWGVDLFQKINAGLLPRVEEVAIDLRVLGFSLLVSLITGLGFGLLPAWQNSNISLQDALSENSRTAAGTGSRRLRSGLVITEVALSLVLLLSAGLLLKSFSRLPERRSRFSPAKCFDLALAVAGQKYRDAAQARTFLRETLRRVQALPGVNESCVTTGFPFGRGGETRYWLEVSPEPANTADRPQAITQAISENYYRVLGIQLLAGRLFSEHDASDTEPIVIVDRQFVRRHFPSRSIDQVIGQRLRFDGDGQPWRRIVGIVGEVRQSQLDEQPRAQIYRPWTQMNEAFAPDFLRAMDLLVKSAGAPADLVPAIKREVQQIDKEQPLGNVAPLESLLDDSIAPRRFYAVLLATFSIVALLLAAIGLYGVMAYTVAQRTREIGIRVALGALRRHILRLVLREGAVLVLIGAAFGLIAAFASSRLLASLLYGVSPTDPQLYLLLSLLLIAVALFACYLPARRAMKIDPMVALRHE